MTIRKRGILAASITALALAATTALAGCAPAAEDTTVKIGVVPGGQPYWDTFVDAAAEEGITVEIVDFAEYPQPNPLLSEGELDLNQFQHIAFLAAHNVDADDDLVPLGATVIYPMNLFSAKYDSIEDIPEGGTIAVPNDESNRARALLVLQKLGLIELADGGNSSSTLDDIIADKSKVTVTELDAAGIPGALPDVDGGVVNNDFVEPAGLSFDDSLGSDSADDAAAAPYTNIFAARADDADNETYLKLVDIYQNNTDVQAAVKDYVGDGAVLLKTPVSELKDILKQAEDDYRAQSK
ncbi:MetQ/NlpA family ABC transporter substrate-binding protein [Leucobacter luti]|uniref:D-methionine transport system substrate-binding protein n=1 Tax=Leucobacter luti TaxID=340320 RepID=A0A4Q7TIV6_9MICO|nr:MetQ/NlpA family ABC transporter substrate-binding protein [Leucobacter luti]MBL3700404.1 methionine ABC transporter substrate-binding protein [Leucobacter luti]RZT60575.1 D-methionine transport system substrate-binding protein [Leucobacter luti]